MIGSAVSTNMAGQVRRLGAFFVDSLFLNAWRITFLQICQCRSWQALQLLENMGVLSLVLCLVPIEIFRELTGLAKSITGELVAQRILLIRVLPELFHGPIKALLPSHLSSWMERVSVNKGFSLALEH